MDDAQREAELLEQRKHWDAASLGWERWWDLIEGATRGVNERLLDLAGLRPGMRVLDVATGLGEPALSAARRVGPKGRVLGVDLAPGMLACAARRVESERVANVDLEQRDVQRLGLDGAGFEAALCRFGLMLVHEPIVAAGAIRAALEPGAYFATAVWGEPAQAPFFSLPTRALSEVLGTPTLPEPALEGDPGPTRLGRGALLRAVLERAGFVDVQLEEAEVRFCFEGGAQFLELLGDISSRLREGLADAGELQRLRFEGRLLELLAPHRTPGGELVLENRVLLARGRAPVAR